MAKQNFDDFLTIFTRHTVWQTTGDSLTISWQQTTKITDFTRLLEAKKHKYILYRHQAPSSFFTGKIDSSVQNVFTTSQRKRTAAKPGRRAAAASRSFLFVPDFRFVRALNELILKWNSLPTSTSKRLTRKLAYLGQQHRKLSVVRDAKLGPHRCCSL